jgi:hypothetical protein
MSDFDCNAQADAFPDAGLQQSAVACLTPERTPLLIMCRKEKQRSDGGGEPAALSNS